MATEKVTRRVLILASEKIGQAATVVIGAAPNLSAKAVTSPRSALTSIAAYKPDFLVFEAGVIPVPAMQAIKNMGELAAAKKVPVIMVCGPLEDSVEQLRETLGIVEVLDEPYESKAVLEAIQGLIEKFEAARRESQMRKVKQQQIRERLRTASDKYAAMSAEAAAAKLNQPNPEVQDFASDDIAPPSEPDPTKPPDEPTWDGSGG